MEIWTESENSIMTFKILFCHSNLFRKFYFYIQIPILHSNWIEYSYFDIQSPILKFKLNRRIVFWHSNWVGKCYFDIQNPVLTFELSRKMLFWYSKSYFDFRTESENRFWNSKSYFNIWTKSENRILIFKILFWHSNWVGKSFFWHSIWVGKCYFDIQNPVLTFELSRKMVFSYWKCYFYIRTELENVILRLIIAIWHSN